MERAAGPVLHNSTRGDALLMNAPQIRPLSRGVGRHLRAVRRTRGHRPGPGHLRIGPERHEALGSQCRRVLPVATEELEATELLLTDPIEGRNQTTQAPYCAAYLSVLATKYGSFIPALSEHNAGGTNVGRALINGEYLGGADVRARYFLGSKLARDLRALPGREYEEVYGSYGLRSYLYAEMVFGNTFNVRRLIASTPQMSIHAMRTPRAISLAEIVKRTGLSADEVRRFNPALVDRVPAQSHALPSVLRQRVWS